MSGFDTENIFTNLQISKNLPTCRQIFYLVIYDREKSLNRRNKEKKKFQTSEISEERINPEGLNSETKNIKDWQEILQIAIKEIPENHRSALLFRVQQEWSYMEIAKVMNANEQMVKTWIHRARQALKAKISELKMKGEL